MEVGNFRNHLLDDLIGAKRYLIHVCDSFGNASEWVVEAWGSIELLVGCCWAYWDLTIFKKNAHQKRIICVRGHGHMERLRLRYTYWNNRKGGFLFFKRFRIHCAELFQQL